MIHVWNYELLFINLFIEYNVSSEISLETYQHFNLMFSYSFFFQITPELNGNKYFF